MKRSWIYFTIAGITLLVVLGCNISGSKKTSVFPKALIGNWTGKQMVKVRYRVDGKFIFKAAVDSINLIIAIQENGKVTGTFGGASLEDCSVSINRGWIGKKLNLATDFSIRGKLKGFIFLEDTLSVKVIQFPFNLNSDNTLLGTLFQKKNFDIYPMAGDKLRKQN